MFGTSRLREMAPLSARRALTGLSLWGWSAPFLIGGMVFSELASIESLRDVVLVLLVGTLAHLALGVVIVLSRYTLLTQEARKQAGWARVLTVVVLAGGARGSAIVWGMEFFGVGVDVAWWGRVFTSMLLITVAFLYTAYSIELWRGYVERRRGLLATIATTETAVDRQQIATDAYRTLVLQGVEDDIEEAKKQTVQVLDQISTRIEAGNLSSEELDVLFSQSDTTWREVSHRAWGGTHPEPPRITARELVVTLLESRPLALPVFVLAAMYALFRVFGLDGGPAAALPLVGSILAGQLLVGWLINRISVTGPPWNQMSFGGGTVVLVAWPLIVSYLWGLDAVGVATVGWLAVVSVFFAVSLGLPIALAESGEQVLAKLEKRVDEGAIRQLRAQGEMFVLAQKIGAYLHGPLRSQFLQLSMELRLSLEKADPYDVANALAKLRDVVRGVESGVDEPVDIAQFLANWSGLIDVETNIHEVHIPARVHHKAATVVTEAVNNAIRHGNATRVGVFFRYRPEGILIEVVGAPDTGDTAGEAGLGAHILDEIAPGRWFSDVTEDGRYRLRVTLSTT